jgi:hypothetical protein
MSGSEVEEALQHLPSGGQFSLDLADIPFDEVLFAVHVQRFTGRIELGAPPQRDHLYFREGALMGVLPPHAVDLQLLTDALVHQKAISREILAAVRDEGRIEDGRALAERLLDHGLVPAAELDRAAAEQARRRLFQVFELVDTEAVIREGIDRLAHFLPTYVDLRPAIAFGMVVRSSPARRSELKARLANRRVKVLAPYDEKRNGYGLPPALLYAMRTLAEGVQLGPDARLPPLGSDESHGLLLLLDRMSLLITE